MIRRAVALLGLAVVVGLVVAAPSGAHEVDPTIRFVIDEAPAVDGISVQVGTSVTSQLVLSNTSGRPVEVLGVRGQPFLRVGPAGVEANLAAPEWYLSNSPFGDGRVPEGASVEAAPRWAKVSEEPSWGWFDHRLHPTAITSDLGDERARTFVVPLRYGDEDLEVRGHLERRRALARFAAELVAIPDATSGFVVQLLQGRAPGLFARHTGAGDAVVIGQHGEPFLRLGPGGAFVNRHSPTWLFTAQVRGEDLTGVDADPDAAPDWALVGDGASYAWVDPRAVIGEVPEQRGTVSSEWRIPIAIGDRTVEVVGRSTARLVPIEELAGPVDGGDDEPGGGLLLVVALAAVTLGAVGWLLRGRTRPTGRG